MSNRSVFPIAFGSSSGPRRTTDMNNHSIARVKPSLYQAAIVSEYFFLFFFASLWMLFRHCPYLDPSWMSCRRMARHYGCYRKQSQGAAGTLILPEFLLPELLLPAGTWYLQTIVSQVMDRMYNFDEVYLLVITRFSGMWHGMGRSRITIF
jgi:hypothetical protein